MPPSLHDLAVEATKRNASRDSVLAFLKAKYPNETEADLKGMISQVTEAVGLILTIVDGKREPDGTLESLDREKLRNLRKEVLIPG